MGVESPDLFASQVLDRSLGSLWPDLTDAQRRDSVTNGESVVWAGATTTSQGAPALTGGTNSASQVQLYAPGTLDPGSSISHWDPAAAPDLLMEPFATPDLGIREGIGLATCALEDIGWSLAAGVRCPDGALESASDDGGDHSSGSGCSGGGGESDDEATIVKVDPVLPLALAVALSGVVRTRPKAQRRLERRGSRS